VAITYSFRLPKKVGFNNHALCAYRRMRGLTQTQLGLLMEMSESAICRYEKGNRIPIRPIVQLMASILQVPEESLYYG
jgi:transcriptional regulator with XRE-family HTH domain